MRTVGWACVDHGLFKCIYLLIGPIQLLQVGCGENRRLNGLLVFVFVCASQQQWPLTFAPHMQGTVEQSNSALERSQRVFDETVPLNAQCTAAVSPQAASSGAIGGCPL